MKKRICFACLVLLISLVGGLFPKERVSATTYDYSSQVTLLKSIDYRNDADILGMLAPTYYTSAEKQAKRQEIAARDGISFLDVPDATVLKELQQEYVVNVFGESFDYVQDHMEQIMQGIFDNLIPMTNGTPLETIDLNAKKILVGLAYLDRMYNFKVGNQNIRDVLYYHPDTFGKSTCQLDLMIYIGNAGRDNLKIDSGANLFGSGKVFTTYVTNATTLDAFLGECCQKFAPGQTKDQWFLEACPAYIEERGTSGLYSRMWADISLRGQILPLLNVSENSLYVIANPTTITYGIVDCYVDRNLKTSNPSLYQTKLAEFQVQLKHAADQQNEFIELWKRLGKPETRNNLTSNRIVYDSFLLYSDDPYASPNTLWSAKYGSQAASGVSRFFSPLKMYVPFMFSDGEAGRGMVRLYLSTALTNRGLCTYNHELTHLIVDSVILNNNGIRDGMGAEIYTRGTFESYESLDPPAISLNLIYDLSGTSNRFQNAAPSRFQTENDLQTYMRGIFDVIYTLDYAEANVILGRSAADRQKWFHKLTQINDTTGNRSNSGGSGYTHKLDQVSAITLAEAGQLNSLNDLIDHNIIAARFEMNGTNTTGTVASNGYYVVPLFSSNYAAVQNDTGVSGDLMIRRQAFELLAEYGYSGGMVPYISNQYKTAAVGNGTVLSDSYILNKVFNGTYATMADFKKAMFQERIDKVGQLKPVTINWKGANVTINDFDGLSALMEEAITSDLQSNIVNQRALNTQVELLKQAVYQAYLMDTSDFASSIYIGGSNSGGSTSGGAGNPSGSQQGGLPNTYAESKTASHVVFFGMMALLTVGAYVLKRKKH